MTTDALIIKGDCLNVMAGLPDGSVDAIVTDPPYGLSFMGKRWDYDVPSVAIWEQCLRVLKPGGHLLAFAGTRTQHRMAVRIEDAGFEIRDMIAWVYGSGFPKSLDVSKAIDNAAGAEREVVGFSKGRAGSLHGGGQSVGVDDQITAPATPAAKQWQGWGTALKPALEPITVARKPLDGTVAENVLKHGTGGLNIDGCRVGAEKATGWGGGGTKLYDGGLSREGGEARPVEGRWPANLIHDGSDEVTGLFPETVGKVGMKGNTGHGNSIYGNFSHQEDRSPGITDTGSAARFFYTAKASKADRDAGCEGLEAIHRANGNKWTDQDYRVANGERPPSAESGPRRNHHPTVKPTALMRYLCRLVTPPGGVILDPFCGSGSTGVAAMCEGFNFIGIELDSNYAEISRRRIDHERNKTPLFSNVI